MNGIKLEQVDLGPSPGVPRLYLETSEVGLKLSWRVTTILAEKEAKQSTGWARTTTSTGASFRH